MEKLTRRRAIRSLTALGIASVGVGYYTWRWEPHWLEFTYPPLPISSLPNELAGCTLAQIADIHVGPQVDDAYLIESFRRVQEINPDFVAFTGDWISYRSPQQFEQLRRVLEHFPHGRLATVGILGNHDYGRHWRMLDVADKVTDIARAAGVTILRNQAVTLSGLQFVGLDDLWSPRFDPVELLAQKSQDPSTLVLSHNPDSADHAVWDRYQGWILAAGTFELSGNRRMYISRGVGHLLRVRSNVRPEIPIFRLQRAVKHSCRWLTD